MHKLWSYSHLQALATVPVPVTEPGTGSVPATEPGTGSRTGLHWWYRIALVVPETVRNSVTVGSWFNRIYIFGEILYELIITNNV